MVREFNCTILRNTFLMKNQENYGINLKERNKV